MILILYLFYDNIENFQSIDEIYSEQNIDDPIYNEILNYLEEDGSRVITIYIYPDTPEGDVTVILGTEIFQLNGRTVPFELQNRINATWTKTVPVSPSVQNSTEIILQENIQKISATNIRNEMKNKGRL